MKSLISVVVSIFIITATVQARIITHGAHTVNMDFVNIGHAGNGADYTGYGSVNYDYQMGTYEVTAEQWLATDPPQDSFFGGLIPFPPATSLPLTYRVTWYRAARFANWLTTGSYETGAYQFNAGGTLTNVLSRAEMLADGGNFYVLPTEDEWYKAAYFKSDGSGYTLYSTGDTVPGTDIDVNSYAGPYSGPWEAGLGTAENNGTYDMAGNVWEWCESALDGTLDVYTESRVLRGGAYDFAAAALGTDTKRDLPPSYYGSPAIGFRVASIPEPSSIFLLSFAGGFIYFRRKILGIR